MVTGPKVEIAGRFGKREIISTFNTLEQVVKALKSNDAEFASAEHIAQARIANPGLSHSVNVSGSWTANAFVYDCEKAYVVTPEFNPILNHLKEATAAYIQNKNLAVSEKEFARIVKAAKADEGRSNPARRRVLIMENQNYDIPVPGLSKDPLAKFRFRETTPKYAKSLQKSGVEEVPVWLIEPKYFKGEKLPIAREEWLHAAHGELPANSCIDGYVGGANGWHSNGTAYGVRSLA